MTDIVNPAPAAAKPAPAKVTLAPAAAKPAPAVDDAPEAAPTPPEHPAPYRVQLREAGKFVINGQDCALAKHAILSSQDYNIDKLLAQRAQLDLIDDDGEVLDDLSAPPAKK